MMLDPHQLKCINTLKGYTFTFDVCDEKKGIESTVFDLDVFKEDEPAFLWATGCKPNVRHGVDGRRRKLTDLQLTESARYAFAGPLPVHKKTSRRQIICVIIPVFSGGYKFQPYTDCRQNEGTHTKRLYWYGSATVTLVSPTNRSYVFYVCVSTHTQQSIYITYHIVSKRKQFRRKNQ